VRGGRASNTRWYESETERSDATPGWTTPPAGPRPRRLRLMDDARHIPHARGTDANTRSSVATHRAATLPFYLRKRGRASGAWKASHRTPHTPRRACGVLFKPWTPAVRRSRRPPDLRRACAPQICRERKSSLPSVGRVDATRSRCRPHLVGRARGAATAPSRCGFGHCSKLSHSGRTPARSMRRLRTAWCRKQPYMRSPSRHGRYLPLHTAWPISSRPRMPVPHLWHAAACACACRLGCTLALLAAARPYKLPPYLPTAHRTSTVAPHTGQRGSARSSARAGCAWRGAVARTGRLPALGIRR
jgi:hypothetical protein